MSIQNKPIYSSSQIIEFYQERIIKHGDTAQGVGWKNDEAQIIRFDQLAKIIKSSKDFSINDLGCGTGRFLKYLHDVNLKPNVYRGYDILEEMIGEAKTQIGVSDSVELMLIKKSTEMVLSDYTIASGIFNVRYKADYHAWTNHIINTLESMNQFSAKGFAFNMLTKYSDAEFMQEYLYYGDPLYFFDYCKVKFSKNVSLLHDYGQFDFTILVRK